MFKFNYREDGRDVQMVIDNGEGETWMEAVETFQRFLVACGYVFDDEFDMAATLEEEHQLLLHERKNTRPFRCPTASCYEED